MIRPSLPCDISAADKQSGQLDLQEKACLHADQTRIMWSQAVQAVAWTSKRALLASGGGAL